jgi:hypothetical protein
MTAVWAVILMCAAATGAASTREYDVVVYGGTSAGVAAAVQTARMGKSVVLIEPSRHIGGLSSGGLGATDIGNKAAIGGIAREFYQRIYRHYADDAAWTQETRDDYFGRLRRREPEADTMWTFEPHVAEAVFREMLKELSIPVFLGERLDLKQGVRKRLRRIREIVMLSGRVFAGQEFVDATYEGDLMALAGVSYTVGREPNALYGETLNGVQKAHAVYHQFKAPVDPYVEPGQRESGLLPGISADAPGEDGEGDARVQAYCYRMCLTDVPENRVPVPRPKGYDPEQYEVLLRYLDTGSTETFGSQMMPNRKTDTNNNGAFSTDNIGMNYDYPNGDHRTRRRIAREHERYQKGLMWFLANDPRVPEGTQEQVARWGLAKDEFRRNGHWPHQLYVREARRMVSAYVMTEQNCRGPRRPGRLWHGLAQHPALRRCRGPRAQRGRRAGWRVLAVPDQLPRHRAQAQRVQEPPRAGMSIGLAHRLWLDPHGTGLHDPRPVGGHGRRARHRRGQGGAVHRLCSSWRATPVGRADSRMERPAAPTPRARREAAPGGRGG